MMHQDDPPSGVRMGSRRFFHEFAVCAHFAAVAVEYDEEDISPAEIKFVQNEEVINLRGDVIPLVRLNEVLDIASTKGPDDNLVVAIVKKGDQLGGLVVDELMGQQEIVIKSLGKYINKSKVISGATILGDGEIALIIDANALL